MNPDLLSATVSMAFLGVMGAALLALLALAGARRRPLLFLTDAAAAAGLAYLFGINAFDWRFIPREALFAIYAAIFAAAAAVALTRSVRNVETGFPAGRVLIRQGAMAYIFAPLGFWRPLVSLLFMSYFLFDVMGWLKGSEAPVPLTGAKDFRPPLFPPRRIRGLREFTLAGLGAAFVYVFAMGVSRPPPEPPRQEETAQTREEPPAPVPEEASAGAETARTYTTVAGETLRSIAKKLYGDPAQWRALAKANPGLKPNARLKAGRTLQLPEQPAQ